MAMGLIHVWIICLLIRFSSPSDVSVLNGWDSLSPSNNRNIVSAGGVFELGFFNPDPSRGDRWYVGIWYKNIPETLRSYVWVANRDTPLNNYNGTLGISGATLVIRDPSDNNRIVWSSASSGSGSPVAKLFDNGNFVLMNSDPGNILWQSFDNPTDTLLPGMKLGSDPDFNSRTAHQNRVLTSWKSSNDPSRGNYTLSLEKQDEAWGLSIMGSENMRLYWSGPWNGAVFFRLPRMFTVTSNNKGAMSCMYVGVPTNNMSMLKLTSSATLFQLSWNQSRGAWGVGWFSSLEFCDRYNSCGDNAYCDMKSVSSTACACIQGYERIGPNMTSGCVKKTSLSCGSDQFAPLVNMSFPYALNLLQLDAIKDLEGCRMECIKDCRCVAFSLSNSLHFDTSSCAYWIDKIQDLRHYKNENGITLHVKLNGKKKRKKNKTGMTIGLCLGIPALLFFGLAIYCCWKRKQSEASASVVRESSTELIENAPLPPMDFEAIVTATDNFANQIGEGGFGKVYRGRLPDGREIAAKRLSDSSNQGRAEFKTEVMLVGNLQHINLVSLIGWSTHGDEMVLVYELLPNGNLETHLFEQSSGALTWQMRYEIIKGTARGVSYLHHDSRFVTVHRDLKPSNILLDEDMLPKISDFGMARVVERGQNQDNTRRTVGTPGYVAPECMMSGDFSTKSDVFAFGMVLLELVTGKKNRTFSYNQSSTNLLTFVFNKCIDEEWGEVIDDAITLDSSQIYQVVRCVRIGLMCVQMDPESRPTMSSVASLLENESLHVSNPRPPGYYNVDTRRHYSSQQHVGETSSSVNDRTLSEILAR